MPIQVLPPQLANQIAAGEVVERPASVVKELVENSIDAGATRIDIDIERGGAKLIRIRDNGSGIAKADLALALARHATSKISSLDDLEAIVSLGFRGEALASISSVSRLMLTSRTAEQNEAWQAYAEGREQNVVIKPAAHPVGCTVEVLDLFYNTPARRKFMRTEKTEFGHIDEVVRRIALACFAVTINLSHNGKLVRQYRAAAEQSQHQRRLHAICGSAFLQHALEVHWQHDDLAIHGWVVAPQGAAQVSEIQYCYVNQRMMRDRLINHAIRQGYQDRLQADQQPAYVLYLSVDPHQVDVNVHPAKHEVRFHQARWVHDFIYQAIVTVLQQAVSEPLLTAPTAEKPVVNQQPDNRAAAGVNSFLPPTSEPSSATEKGDQPATAHYQTGSGYQKREGAVYGRLLQTSSLAEQRFDNTRLTQVAATHPTAEPLAPAAQLAEPETVLTTQPLATNPHSLGRLLMIYPPHYALLAQQQQLRLINLLVAEQLLRQMQLTPPEEGLRPQPLLIPLKLTVNKQEAACATEYKPLLIKFGLDLQIETGYLTLCAVPLPLRQQNLAKLIPELLGYLANQQQVSATIVAAWLATQLISEHQQWNHAQAIQLLSEVERFCPQWVKAPPAALLQPVDLQVALAALNNEQT
ncbi:DNA mismatch repair endonuclease MutL [Serratia microhaemolytica]|uniref:DNA mismatch repair endonuclease MutL n=1 Tax=Serratia microhaemolytica TaxID=2675110 RepID=UPI000FDEBF6E|nr:DNA mismatch repair endonuclease MutL [Serratia microhaemolytica]